MPIYDYLCTACDHRADILQGLNDPGPNFCPSCGAEGTMRKQFAAPAIHFKGSGWAKKDRGGSGAGKAASAKAASQDSGGDSGGSSGGDSGGASGGETKQPSGGTAPAASSTGSSD
jgi:putative FmdB family regulatory protein